MNALPSARPNVRLNGDERHAGGRDDVEGKLGKGRTQEVNYKPRVRV